MRNEYNGPSTGRILLLILLFVMRNVKRENSYIRKNPNTGTLGKLTNTTSIRSSTLFFRGSHHPPNREQACLPDLWAICTDTGRGVVWTCSQSNLCTRKTANCSRWLWQTLVTPSPPLIIIATSGDANAIGAIVSIVTGKHDNQRCAVTLDADQVVLLLDYSLVLLQSSTWYNRTCTTQYGRIGIGEEEWGVGAETQKMGKWTGIWRHLFYIGGGVCLHWMVLYRFHRCAGSQLRLDLNLITFYCNKRTTIYMVESLWMEATLLHMQLFITRVDKLRMKGNNLFELV